MTTYFSLTRPLIHARFDVEMAIDALLDRGVLSVDERTSVVTAVCALTAPEALEAFRDALRMGTCPANVPLSQTIVDAIRIRMDAVKVYAMDGDPAILASIENADSVLDQDEFVEIEMTLEKEVWELLYYMSYECGIPESDHWWGYRVGKWVEP